MTSSASVPVGGEELSEIEMDLLLEGIARVYGYDFRDYAEASIRRRLRHWLGRSGFSSFATAQEAVLRDPSLFDGLLRGVTVNVSEMFRDPLVFRAIREQVIPHLKTYPFVKIWHAGCAGGQEPYSMAILLEEEGLAGRYRIYATDINRDVLHRAKDGIFPLSDMDRFEQNYRAGGGKRSLSDYYFARYDHALLSPELKKSIVFAPHNLAVDGEFGEMELIFCRNVLIYFREHLKERALRLLDSSLAPGCFLCLGTKETLEGRSIARSYREIPPHCRIYRKGYQ